MNGITLIPCTACGRGYPPSEMLRYIGVGGKELFYCHDCWRGTK